MSTDLTPSNDDKRTHAERMLAIIEATLEGRAVDGIHSYSIGGRTVAKIPLPELAKLADMYRVKVAMQRRRRAGHALSLGTIYFRG